MRREHDSITLIRGADKVFTVMVYANTDTIEPFDLTGTTDIKVFFRKEDDSVLMKNLSNGVSIVSVQAGKIQISLEDAETPLLSVGEFQSFEIEIHQGPVVNIVQFVEKLTVRDRIFS